MTDLLVAPIEDTITETAEGDSVHVLCCVTESDDMALNRSLCGIVLNNPNPVDYTVDFDCEKCEILEKERFCPVFGICQGE